MGLDPKPIVADIDRVLKEAEELLRRVSHEGKHSGHVEAELTGSAFTMLAAALHRYAPPGSPYVSRATAITHVIPFEAHHLLGFLKALRADYEHGAIRTVAELVHADTFADYLDMASHLLGEGYKDAAAVIAGSTLEAHLRALAAKYSVDTHHPDGKAKKANLLTADLVKAGAYTTAIGQGIVSWLLLRNDAAHGDYTKYDVAQVRLLIESIRHFMTTHPATPPMAAGCSPRVSRTDNASRAVITPAGMVPRVRALPPAAWTATGRRLTAHRPARPGRRAPRRRHRRSPRQLAETATPPRPRAGRIAGDRRGTRSARRARWRRQSRPGPRPARPPCACPPPPRGQHRRCALPRRQGPPIAPPLRPAPRFALAAREPRS